MNWEQTIQYIRTQPEYSELVEKAYLDENLSLNVERFRRSAEFLETLRLLKLNAPRAVRLLDLGSGNGISAVAFALEGYQVMAVEPDPSYTVGAGAIRSLKLHFGLSNIDVHESFTEDIKLNEGSFDIVYSRQCMHHAYDLLRFVESAYRLLDINGLFFTVRDHVIYDHEDKKLFLSSHPLQKFYGGENAFTLDEYVSAFVSARFTILKQFRFFDSVINYSPMHEDDINEKQNQMKRVVQTALKRKVSLLAYLPFMSYLYAKNKNIPLKLDESNYPGRMYSFLARK